MQLWIQEPHRQNVMRQRDRFLQRMVHRLVAALCQRRAYQNVLQHDILVTRLSLAVIQSIMAGAYWLSAYTLGCIPMQ